MFVILPFEKEFYKKFDYDVTFVGHPLIDAIANKGLVKITQFRFTTQITIYNSSHIGSCQKKTKTMYHAVVGGHRSAVHQTAMLLILRERILNVHRNVIILLRLRILKCHDHRGCWRVRKNSSTTACVKRLNGLVAAIPGVHFRRVHRGGAGERCEETQHAHG